jgi:hypothetical protein
MANEENLVQFSGRSRGEVEALNALGGINSGETRRKPEWKAERKAMRCIADMLLNARAELSKEEREQFERMGFDPDEMTVQAKLVWSQIMKGYEGDTRAAEFVRDTVGEKPKDSMALSHELTGSTEIRLWFPDDNAD